MKILAQYLNELMEPDKIDTGDKMHCSVCGRVVEVKKAGTGPLICCGKHMDKME